MILRPEVEWLLYCAQTWESREAREARGIAPRLPPDFDWAEFIRLGLRHRIIPLLHQKLNALDAGGAEAVPADILVRLREHNHTNLRRNLLLTAQLLGTLKLFEEHGIRAIPYKGPVQTAFLYNSLALRQFKDIDILVSRPDLLQARDLLLSRGYIASSSDQQEQEDLLESTFEHHYCFHHREKQIAIELHWAIYQDHFSAALDFDQLWERLIPISVMGTTVRSFAREDLVLILAVHGTKHLWMRLHWLCDLAALIHQQPLMEWERVLSQARALGWGRMLHLSLCLAQDVLKVPLPTVVRQELEADPIAKTLADQLRRRLVPSERDPIGRVESRLLHLLRQQDMAVSETTVAPGIARRKTVEIQCTSICLPIANSLLGIEFPQQLAERMHTDPVITQLAVQLRTYFLSRIEVPLLEAYHFHVRARERVRDKLRYALLLIFCPTQTEQIMLRQHPAPRLFYYVLRPLRLIGIYGLNPFQLSSLLRRLRREPYGKK